jgi:hypothetical protein
MCMKEALILTMLFTGAYATGDDDKKPQDTTLSNVVNQPDDKKDEIILYLNSKIDKKVCKHAQKPPNEITRKDLIQFLIKNNWPIEKANKARFFNKLNGVPFEVFEKEKH